MTRRLIDFVKSYSANVARIIMIKYTKKNRIRRLIIRGNKFSNCFSGLPHTSYLKVAIDFWVIETFNIALMNICGDEGLKITERPDSHSAIRAKTPSRASK